MKAVATHEFMGPTHPHFRSRQIEDVSTQQFTELDSFSFLFTSNEGCVCLLTVFFRIAVTRHLKKHELLGQQDCTRLLASE